MEDRPLVPRPPFLDGGLQYFDFLFSAGQIVDLVKHFVGRALHLAIEGQAQNSTDDAADGSADCDCYHEWARQGDTHGNRLNPINLIQVPGCPYQQQAIADEQLTAMWFTSMRLMK